LEQRGENFETKIIGLSEKKDRPKIVLEIRALLVLASGAAHINQYSDVV
jgi:hypothetical protein